MAESYSIAEKAMGVDGLGFVKALFGIDGGADIYVYNVNAYKTEIAINGAASVDLSGKTESFDWSNDPHGIREIYLVG